MNAADSRTRGVVSGISDLLLEVHRTAENEGRHHRGCLKRLNAHACRSCLEYETDRLQADLALYRFLEHAEHAPATGAGGAAVGEGAL